MTHLADWITEWFQKHDDGEFIVHSESLPISVRTGVRNVSRTVLTTKAHLFDACGSVPFSILGICGLPDARTIEHIIKLCNGSYIGFLGDLDPPDILIYLHLRELLDDITVTHIGINDAFLHCLGDSWHNVRIPLCMSEQACISSLVWDQLNLDWLVGEISAECLRSGVKVELEAALGVRVQDFLEFVANNWG